MNTNVDEVFPPINNGLGEKANIEISNFLRGLIDKLNKAFFSGEEFLISFIDENGALFSFLLEKENSTKKNIILEKHEEVIKVLKKKEGVIADVKFNKDGSFIMKF